MTILHSSEKKIFLSDYMYNLLISTDKSEEYAVDYLKMTINKRRMTSIEIHKMTDIFADIVISRLDTNSQIDLQDRKKLINESLHETLVRYDNVEKKNR